MNSDQPAFGRLLTCTHHSSQKCLASDGNAAFPDVLCREGQERHVARPLQCNGEMALMLRAGAGLSPGLDLAAIR